jgi:hypothetical protein
MLLHHSTQWHWSLLSADLCNDRLEMHTLGLLPLGVTLKHIKSIYNTSPLLAKLFLRFKVNGKEGVVTIRYMSYYLVMVRSTSNSKVIELL